MLKASAVVQASAVALQPTPTVLPGSFVEVFGVASVSQRARGSAFQGVGAMLRSRAWTEGRLRDSVSEKTRDDYAWICRKHQTPSKNSPPKNATASTRC